MVIIAFVSLGLLVGHITGMTSAPVSNNLIGLIFAFGGGTAISYLRKIPEKDRRAAAICIASLCISCLLGLFSGILINEYKLLSPKSADSSDFNQLGSSKYLKKSKLDKIYLIHHKYRVEDITCVEAYDEIFSIVTKTDNN